MKKRIVIYLILFLIGFILNICIGLLLRDFTTIETGTTYFRVLRSIISITILCIIAYPIYKKWLW